QKASSTTRSFPYILKRARALDDQLRQFVLKESNQMAKQINFYDIMKTDLLFYEFMDEVIKNKLQNNDLIYEKKDINIFFNEKADYNEKLAKWSDSTMKRLKSSYNRLLLEIGYLEKLSSTDLIRSEEHTSELQSRFDLVCRLLLEKKNIMQLQQFH